MKTGFRLAGAALFVSAIFPCAIDTSPLFVPRHRPEKLNSAFVRGKLGILTPTLSEEYKLIAWRYLSGLPLSQQEQVAALSPPGVDGSSKAIEQWRKARESAGLPVIYFGTAKVSRIAPGNFYDNCLDSAFTTASETLADRMQRYPGKQAVASWVQAQDQVFKNCSGEMPVYPPDPDPGTSELERADRMYQIAAAHFHAEDFDDAEARFRAIAADARSPWRDTAAYMTGRVLLRDGTLTGRTGALESAVSAMAKITTGPLHDSAQGMIGYINSLQDPASVLKSLSIKLTLSKDETVLNPAMA
ncbi:MAG TPA: hypothetical protein VG273_25015, partial [Bryobacteraceae bacterium]|nr:hypothetical protein [Bryobacteraceae bacterium]